jgi:hypothetical protein
MVTRLAFGYLVCLICSICLIQSFGTEAAQAQSRSQFRPPPQIRLPGHSKYPIRGSGHWAGLTVETETKFDDSEEALESSEANGCYIIYVLNQYSFIQFNCTDVCFEHNCSKAVTKAWTCPEANWLAFAPMQAPCVMFPQEFETFNSNLIPIPVNYEVYGVDRFRSPMLYTRKIIRQDFRSVINYGCAVLQQYTPTAVWFGIRRVA